MSGGHPVLEMLSHRFVDMCCGELIRRPSVLDHHHQRPTLAAHLPPLGLLVLVVLLIHLS